MRLIDADALMEKAYWHGDRPDFDNLYPDGVQAVDVKDIEASPTIDPVKHGYWVWNSNAYDWNLGAWCCSECGRYNSDIGRDPKFVYRNVWSNFCNCCGAKMGPEVNG